ncbi:MAG: 23S rRNA (guanosine(2251)-2'-O)-methyltransferase RlmB [Alphaproteobacteria bacterium]
MKKYRAPHEKKQTKTPENKAPQGERRRGERERGQRLAQADLYGFHAVRAAWLNEARQVKTLYCTQSALEGFEEALGAARAKGLSRPQATILDKAQLEKTLPQGAVHQGLALVTAGAAETGLEDILIRERGKERSLILILDQVTDPHNVGAILRSACAFGAAGMILQKKHAPELSGALAKTACGAVEHVPVAYETNLSRSIEALQEAGYFVYGLDERGEDIASANTAGKSALVLGAEGPGLRRLVKEHCDALLRLPMCGAMPSINVSNAAAVALYAFSKS